MRYQFVLITLALCLQVALLWTLGVRIDKDTGAVAIQPKKIIAPKTSPLPANVESQQVVTEAELAPVLAQIKPEPAAQLIQQMFFADNRDHQLIEQAIRDKLGYDTGKRPTAPLTDRMVEGLTYLDLKGKGLTDIRPLAMLAALQQVDLEKNRVNDLSPLEQLPMLNAVYMRNNSGLTLAEVRRAGRVMRQCIIVHNLK
jgi:hypothetical protein|tara:strand:+ start:1466 stop:2062 length:597 start_codon:yes stop_codon:yes gene_type:complete